MKRYRVLENKGSYKTGCIVNEFEAFYYDLKVEQI
jgi:hypothetical protein